MSLFFSLSHLPSLSISLLSLPFPPTPPLLHSASYTLPPFCQPCLTPFLYSTPSLPHKLLLVFLHSLFFLSDSLTFFYFPSPLSLTIALLSSIPPTFSLIHSLSPFTLSSFPIFHPLPPFLTISFSHLPRH